MTRNRLIAYCLLLVIASGLAATKALDHYGYQYTDQALKRSLVAFGIARGLNGLISVAQEAEIAMQPAGVGLTLSPGEILDPVNDLIERFSVVMLFSASALGIQKLLLAISAWGYFNFIAIIFWLGLVGWLFYRHKKNKNINPWLVKTALFLVLVRFVTPVMALTSEAIYDLFLEQNYVAASQSLEQVTETLEQESETINQTESDNFLERAQNFINKTTAQLDIRQQIESYKAAAEQASKDVIQLITVFIVQTILFPLLFLWLSWKLVLNLTHRK